MVNTDSIRHQTGTVVTERGGGGNEAAEKIKAFCQINKSNFPL